MTKQESNRQERQEKRIKVKAGKLDDILGYRAWRRSIATADPLSGHADVLNFESLGVLGALGGSKLP
jgi:hypothetical protein